MIIHKPAGKRVKLKGEELELLPQKALFIPDSKMLVIADLHLGKASHFRRFGIPVPVQANDRNIELLIDVIQTSKAKEVVFLGDLFHSHYNGEWEVLGQVINHFTGIQFELVRGNHDIMSNLQYERHSIKVSDQKVVGPFLLTHHPQEKVDASSYNLAGHIHPGAWLVGRARQSMTLPCFYFGKHSGLLPAFGSFTGLAKIPIQKEDQVYMITNGEIIPMEHD